MLVQACDGDTGGKARYNTANIERQGLGNQEEAR